MSEEELETQALNTYLSLPLLRDANPGCWGQERILKASAVSTAKASSPLGHSCLIYSPPPIPFWSPQGALPDAHPQGHLPPEEPRAMGSGGREERNWYRLGLARDLVSPMVMGNSYTDLWSAQKRSHHSPYKHSFNPQQPTEVRTVILLLQVETQRGLTTCSRSRLA